MDDLIFFINRALFSGAVLGSILGGAVAAVAATPETPTLMWSEHAMRLRVAF